MVITSTGAGSAVTKVIPELKDKLTQINLKEDHKNFELIKEWDTNNVIESR